MEGEENKSKRETSTGRMIMRRVAGRWPEGGTEQRRDDKLI